LGKIKDIDVEDYWHVINYNYSQIQFAEIKASAVISIYSILIGLGFTLDILDDENDYNLGFDSFYWIIKVILFIAAFYFTIVSLKRCIQCILPILNIAVKKSPLFFGDIKNFKDFESFNGSFNELLDSPKEYKTHLTQMVYATANITSIKFFNVNLAMRHLLKSIVFYALFFLSLYLL
jgi:hypothetical protein